LSTETGLAASVHARLLQKARQSGRTFNELLQYFGMERFLYRLSQSAHRDRFILKGALMLSVWDAPLTRPTMDIDLLGRLRNDLGQLVAVVQEVCCQDVEADGIVFDESSVKAERIVEGAEYSGVRVRFRGTLGGARIPMQLDVGFGDAVIPDAVLLPYPTILASPAFLVMGYSRESTIAEKFETMVKLGRINSRMKDFYDIRLLSRQFDFQGHVLADAVRATFERRGTILDTIATERLAEIAKDPNKTKQWNAFLRKIRANVETVEFDSTIDSILAFLGPVVAAVSQGESFTDIWTAPGPWNSV
jgi:hypothetical protein